MNRLKEVRILQFFPAGVVVSPEDAVPDDILGSDSGALALAGSELPFPDWAIVLEVTRPDGEGIALAFPIHRPEAVKALFTAGWIGRLTVRFGPDGPSYDLAVPNAPLIEAVMQVAGFVQAAQARAEQAGPGRAVWN